MDKAQAIQNFWSSFGLDAFDENTVPKDAQLPYITYSFSTGSFDEPVTMVASVWYRDTSWSAISKKTDQISTEIGRGGITLAFDDGWVWIKRGLPFAQRTSEPNDASIRRVYLNIEVEFFSEN